MRIVSIQGLEAADKLQSELYSLNPDGSLGPRIEDAPAKLPLGAKGGGLPQPGTPAGAGANADALLRLSEFARRRLRDPKAMADALQQLRAKAQLPAAGALDYQHLGAVALGVLLAFKLFR